jgi:hypothetical protein
MSFKASLVRLAIKMTPESLIRWVANIVLKEIAELKHFHFDLASRKFYVEVQLVGESETIQIWSERFYVIHENDSYSIVVEEAKSNRVWLTNILSRIVGKTWKLPEVPQLKSHMSLVSELLAPKA